MTSSQTSIGGSPPRVWGIHPQRRCARASMRFTPTRVGNTAYFLLPFINVSVHPHACGEYFGCIAASKPLCGSPPRVWGIPEIWQQWTIDMRFTPTRVGNTDEKQADGNNLTVHPHACGEYWNVQKGGTHGIGSPPRVWGIRGGAQFRCIVCRFTPTRVGNT